MTRHLTLILFSILLSAGLSAPISAQETHKVSVEGLIYDLRHPEGERRKAAARILGEQKVRQAVPALIDATTDRDNSVRLEVTRALVQINDTRALQAYINLCSDPEKNIQVHAIEGIVQVYVTQEDGFVRDVKSAWNFINPLSDDFNPVIVEPYVPVSEKAVLALIEQIGDNDTRVRKDAVIALGILRARAALPTIRDALLDETDDGVTIELIRTVYKIGDPAAGRFLIPLIKHRSKKVHGEAIFTVGRLRVTEAVPVLRSIYESDAEQQRTIFGFVPVSGRDELQKKSLQALAYIGDRSTKDIFVNSLSDQRDTYRRYASEGLARVGDDNVLQDIARAQLRERSQSVKLAMAFALYRLGREEHLIQLVEKLKDGDQAYEYLLELEPAEVPKLYRFLETEKKDVRVRLLDVIGLRGDSSSLSVVERVAEEESGDVASAAILAVRRLRGRFQG